MSSVSLLSQLSRRRGGADPVTSYGGEAGDVCGFGSWLGRPGSWIPRRNLGIEFWHVRRHLLGESQAMRQPIRSHCWLTRWEVRSFDAHWSTIRWDSEENPPRLGIFNGEWVLWLNLGESNGFSKVVSGQGTTSTQNMWESGQANMHLCRGIQLQCGLGCGWSYKLLHQG